MRKKKMLDYTVPREQIEALAVLLAETENVGDVPVVQEIIYSAEFQNIARTIQLTTIDQVERMASEQGDYDYALWFAREVAQGRSVDKDAE
jgi:hypothetical protein